MNFKKIGVVGCGQMGAGIAQVTACAGLETLVSDQSRERLEKGLAGIERSLARLESKGKLTPEARNQAFARLKGTVELSDFSDCDLVIEAATEDQGIKEAIFKELDSVCGARTILASNTSSLSITQLMTLTKRPDRFLGIHFFNPVPVMGLVEVVRTLATDTAVYNEACAFVESLGKTAVRCEDRTGFLVNRLLIPYLLDAVRAYESGTGSMEDIDSAMKLGCGHPMGPFQLMDFIGLDTIKQIAEILFDEFREARMAPPPLLKRMVYAGNLGRKTGRGFYSYEEGN